jgi:hypothetical protein
MTNNRLLVEFLFLTCLITLNAAVLTGDLAKLDWLAGKWRSEFSGKVFWPTVPTMTYGEELIIQEAPIAKSSGVRFLNFRFVFTFILFLFVLFSAFQVIFAIFSSVVVSLF